MTDATITDLTQHRLAKNGLDDWPNSRILSRLTLLRAIDKGGIEALGVPTSEVFRAGFPEGFDPLNHPEDNLTYLENLAKIRGVFKTSQ